MTDTRWLGSVLLDAWGVPLCPLRRAELRMAVEVEAALFSPVKPAWALAGLAAALSTPGREQGYQEARP